MVKLHQLRDSRDITFDSWAYCLCIQFVQDLSVITVCIPYIKNALAGLESGMLQTGDFRLQRPSKLSSSQKSRSLAQSGSSREQRTFVSSQQDGKSAKRRSFELNPMGLSDPKPFGPPNTVVIESSTGGGDQSSQSSQTRIIKKTTEWRIDRDDPEELEYVV